MASPLATYGVVVKLTRTLMIIPITIALAVMTRRREIGGARPPRSSSRIEAAQGDDPTRQDRRGRTNPSRGFASGSWCPGFSVGFLLAAAFNSLGGVPQAAHSPLSTLSLFLITMALSGIGLSTRPLQLRNAGLRAAGSGRDPVGDGRSQQPATAGGHRHALRQLSLRLSSAVCRRCSASPTATAARGRRYYDGPPRQGRLHRLPSPGYVAPTADLSGGNPWPYPGTR